LAPCNASTAAASRTIFKKWAEINPVHALQYAGRTPPKPLVGRWGAISACEAVIVAPPVAEARLVLQDCIGSRGKKRDTTHAKHGKKRKSATALGDGSGNGDDLALQDDGAPQPVEAVVEGTSNHSFSIAMGRWARDTVALLSSICFWWVVQVVHKCRGPLDHLLHVLEAKQKHATHEGSTLATLVYGKADEILCEFGALLNFGAWQGIWGAIPTSDHGKAHQIIITLVCSCAANYHKRFVELLGTMPYQILWLAFASPTVVCQQRARVAKLILEEAAAHDPEYNSARMIIDFKVDLQHSASTGLCSTKLYTFALGVREQWCCDTQAQERANSIITCISRRSPNISLSLLAGPTLSKHQPRLASRLRSEGSPGKKYSTTQFILLAALQFHLWCL
jgi:hypothetical protein